jgi:hypothetical protein
MMNQHINSNREKKGPGPNQWSRWRQSKAITLFIFLLLLALYRLYDIIGRLYTHTHTESHAHIVKKSAGEFIGGAAIVSILFHDLIVVAHSSAFFFLRCRLYMIFSVYFVTYRRCCWLLSHSMEMKICFFWMRREPDLELPSQNVISHSMDEGHDFESLSVPFRQQRQLLFSLINVLTTIYEPECLYVSCKTHVTPLTACRLFFSPSSFTAVFS